MSDNDKWSSAAFVAMSETLPPDEIQKIIGLSPSRTHRIGDPVSPRSKATTHNRHYYSIQSTCNESEGMEKHIDEILCLLEPRIDTIRRLSKNADLCLFCGFSSGNGQGGFTLSPAMLARLTHLGLEVVLDLYPPETSISEEKIG